jgi:hypothetical protein
VPEGLSPPEVGKEISEHQERVTADADHDHRDRWMSIVEALLLSVVAVLAAYSGYAAAKWGTESSVMLAKASAARTKANQAALEALVIRTADSASFNAWFTGFTAGDKNAERLAVKRMRPGYLPAFNAWLATDPAHNLNAPRGPAYMPQYVIPPHAQAKAYGLSRYGTASGNIAIRIGSRPWIARFSSGSAVPSTIVTAMITRMIPPAIDSEPVEK